MNTQSCKINYTKESPNDCHCSSNVALCLCSCFYTRQQHANLAVLFTAGSTDLDRKQYVRGLFVSTNMTPQGVHFLPPPLLCKSKSSMCWQLREMGGGVDDPHCFKTRKQLITAVSPSLHPQTSR